MKAGSLTFGSRETKTKTTSEETEKASLLSPVYVFFFGTRTVAGEGVACDPWMTLLLMSGNCIALFVRCECSIYFVLVIVFCSAGGG